jgi:hypothetical protein
LTYIIELILALADKASLNHYVGGDPWEFYIGNLEIGIWMFSFVNDESSPELEHINSADQKERRHITRVSNIVRNLKDKLSRFPERNDPEFESFEQGLYQEAQKLFLEPNGKELLSLLGEIYKTKSESSRMKQEKSDVHTWLSKEAILSKCWFHMSKCWFLVDLSYGLYLTSTGLITNYEGEVKDSFNFLTGTKIVYIIKYIFENLRSQI